MFKKKIREKWSRREPHLFNKSRSRPRAGRPGSGVSYCGKAGYVILGALLLTLIPACQTVPLLPGVNLSETGWHVRQGQAVWRSRKDAPEIAGELLLATRSDGASLVQFIKPPLPLIVAQTTSNSWQLHIVPNDKTYSGKGKPPARLIWLHLPGCLAGSPLPKPWRWQTNADNGWRLENWATGESLEGYLAE